VRKALLPLRAERIQVLDSFQRGLMYNACAKYFPLCGDGLDPKVHTGKPQNC